MEQLLELLGKRKTLKILAHHNFSAGIKDLIREGYVEIKDDDFILTVKGENARKEGIPPETEPEDLTQLKRNNLNKSITELPPPKFKRGSTSIFILILAFFIFLFKYLPLEKINWSNYKLKWWKNRD
ncbi:hypothetical protein FK178_02470 [Antarcticibacterium arcticum]|uniref:Uncharacterized protein n=1 Tax=Antarcticibacterium arcticum TaxID=2585771 RepID=A0A5B8YFW2_9FLAO|nr:hypothetical protein [Antarcticibacterium arcticum]QED36644.1 hypothetical protein FK178_02470 [Antarcticibacterium arcticum]